MKKIVCLGNCQFGQLHYLLSNLLSRNEYETSYFSNNARSGNLQEIRLILKAIREADFLIYQPLGRDHGELSQKNIQQGVKSTCRCIAMEYAFNSGVYSLCHAPFRTDHGYGRIFGEECVLELAREKTGDAILEDYKNGVIDFKLHARFDECALQMEEREARSRADILLADFIRNNYRHEKLFHTHNHPTNALFAEILRQLIRLTSLPVRLSGLKKLKELDVIRSPVSPYDVTVHGYAFGSSSDWLEKGKKLVSLILREKRLS